jgi:hypothetical protein
MCPPLAWFMSKALPSSFRIDAACTEAARPRGGEDVVLNGVAFNDVCIIGYTLVLLPQYRQVQMDAINIIISMTRISPLIIISQRTFNFTIRFSQRVLSSAEALKCFRLSIICLTFVFMALT